MSQGCPIPIGDGICGEPNSLEIISQFNKLFQERLVQIESQADGGCLLEKIKLQEEWIHDLTEQNNMLVQAVQQLESEAIERVHQLEDRLQRSGQCLREVMKKYREHNFAADLVSEPLQKIAHYEDDIKNVLEFIRRIREEQQWNLDGLFFYNIRKIDLLGSNQYANKLDQDESSEGKEQLCVKEGTIKELTEKMNYYESFGNLQELTRELHCRRQECETLKQEMADARQALAEEVAAKHDQVLLLKKELQAFEERCLQSDKQTAFKEDIIRELRKEIKHLKQQFTQEEVSKLNITIEELRDNLEKTRFMHDEEDEAHRKEISLLNATISNLKAQMKAVDEKDQKGIKACRTCKKRSKVSFLENTEVQADLEVKEADLMKALKEEQANMRADIERKNSEINTLKNKVNELEAALKSCEERANNLQDAVSLYSNSVSVLETAEEAAKLQIQQQKVTISNLQQAVVEAKQEVDEIRKKSQDNVSGSSSWAAWFGLVAPSDVASNNNDSKLNNQLVHDL